MNLARIRHAIRAHWRSPLALGLAVVHVVLFTTVILSREPLPPCPSSGPDGCLEWNFFGVYIAGRYFHNDLDFYLLSLADLPAGVLAAVMGPVIDASLPVLGVKPSIVAQTYVVFWFLVISGTMQWWLGGIWLAARRAQHAA